MIPKYLMDENGFYYNPESPECPWQPRPECSWDDFVKIRIPVNLYADFGRVIPGDNLSEWIERAGVKRI
jgi:hypothetical protein